MECEILEKIVSSEPSPEMTDEFNGMSDSEQESISYDESKEYYLDKKKYNKLHEKHDFKMAKHMIECDNPDCKRVLENWKNDKELSKYTENK